MLFRACALYETGAIPESLAAMGDLLDIVDVDTEAQVFVSTGKSAKALLNAAARKTAEEPRLQRIRDILRRFTALDKVVARLYPLAVTPKRDAGPALRVYGFGPGRVDLNGEAVPASAWGSVTARQLLFYMLIHNVRSREQIFADFWPELSAQKAKTSFHTTKFRLNRPGQGRDRL